MAWYHRRTSKDGVRERKLCVSVDFYLCAMLQRKYWFTDITILAYTDENYFMVMTDNHKMSDIKILDYVVKVD